MSDWSPEPWTALEFVGDWLIEDSRHNVVANYHWSNDLGEDNCNRIVSCVNALAGITDPAAELERLRRIEASHADLLSTLIAICTDAEKFPDYDSVCHVIARAEAARK